jgi:hypothetical protein
VYSYANETPNIVYELLLGGVLTATLVPQFVKHLQDRDPDASSAVVTVAMLALVVLTVLGVVLAPYIVDIYTCGDGPSAVHRSSRPSCSALHESSTASCAATGLLNAPPVPRPRSLRSSTTSWSSPSSCRC